jgi:hypothetical protein
LRKRILLDECLPRDLKRHLEDHDTKTVPEAGWASKENGELLALAASDFDVFVTVDRNLSFQQNLSNLEIAVVVLVARGNRLVDLEPLVPGLLRAVSTIERGQVVRVDV